jgi:hypothetical protein
VPVVVILIPFTTQERFCIDLELVEDTFSLFIGFSVF